MWNFFCVNSFHVELSVTRKQILNFMNYIIDMQHCIQNKIKLCAQSLLSFLFSKHSTTHPVNQAGNVDRHCRLRSTEEKISS